MVRNGNAAIIGNADAIGLILQREEARLSRTVYEQVVTFRGDRRSGKHGGAVADCSRTVGALENESVNRDRHVALVVEFDELIARCGGAAGPPGSSEPELADHDCA